LLKPNHRVGWLNSVLSELSGLLGSTFSLADVAIASYGLCVLLFFPQVSIAVQWPSLARYLKSAAQRPAYAEAFGKEMQSQLVQRLRKDLEQHDVTQ